MSPKQDGKRKLFGTDGIRGVANVDLTPELAMRVGYAAVEVLKRKNPRPVLLVGRDTRVSGDMLEAALVAGICSAGGSAELLGVIPPPAVAYLVGREGADAGVVISASHNPARDNGIKFFHRDGFKLPDEMEAEMEERIREEPLPARMDGDAVGQARPCGDAEEKYLDHLLSLVKPDLAGMKVVLDCANGAAYRVAPALMSRLGAEVEVINASPDGLNINHRCGAVHCEGLQRAVVERGADLGLAFDGDADRLMAVDEKGRLIDGDFIMAICALHLKGKGRLRHNAVVATVMSNLGFRRAMKREGIEVFTTEVGDRHVLEKMLSGGYNLGGEQSGHIIFLDDLTTGDGLLTALRLLEVMAEEGEPLSSLAGVMEKVPQLLLNVRVRDKERLYESERIAASLRRWEEELGERGRVLVRPSGTEPIIRVMVEALEQELAERAARELAAVVEREIG